MGVPLQTTEAEQKRLVLEGIREVFTIAEAAKKVNLPSSLVYAWMDADEKFRREVDNAREDYVDKFEKAFIEKALTKGGLDAIAFLNAYRPKHYKGGKQAVEHSGGLDIKVTLIGGGKPDGSA